MVSSGSESDFEDPDSLEVPGGGKDLASLLPHQRKDFLHLNNNIVKPKVFLKPGQFLKNLRIENSKQVLSGVDSSFLTTFDRNGLSINDKENINCKVTYSIPEQALQQLLGVKNENLLLNNIGLIQRRQVIHEVKNTNLPLYVPFSGVVGTQTQVVSNEVENNEEEGMGVAETYADYMPSKVKIGIKHPDPVVESTSLSSVEPADVWYNLMIPHTVVATGALSALQLESITYACQQHERNLPTGARAGFLIGDGAGVGKGRTVAGIVYENYLRGRKRAIWISVTNDLKVDAERDLSDIGASKIRVYSLNKFKYTKINSPENGKIKKGVVFSTYNAIIARTNQSDSTFETRFEQLIDWCGTDFDGVIVFDECHKAKNLCAGGSGKSTKTGQTVLELQTKLPGARVVYASATGATEPKDMAYMVRLGLWGAGTPYKNFTEFLSVLAKRGVGAMEIVAMDMKLRGLYIARQLSFRGVMFKVVEANLSETFKKIYDRSTVVWAEAFTMFREASEFVKTEKSVVSVMWSQFWGAHQRFYKYMCISAKVKHAINIAREAVKCGKCVVIGLQSTGEARTLDQIEKDDGELTDFVSSALGVLRSLVEKHFPVPSQGYNRFMEQEQIMFKSSPRKKRRRKNPKIKKKKLFFDIPIPDESSMEVSSSSSSDEDKQVKDVNSFFMRNGYYDSTSSKVFKMKSDLLKKIEKLGKELPPNALDELIDELGGPENVAEMTGRKGRVIQNDGCFKYVTRSGCDTPLEVQNLLEKQRFMDGEKDIAIISEAASSGISLHSDKRAINRRCRVHITLELPWSADKAIQQFGRTHRSNQSNAPEYVLLISDLGGERRFASVVAKKLESLGALTQGDRRATEARDLSKFNIDNTYGRMAVEIVLKSFLPYQDSSNNAAPPASYKGNFMEEARDGLMRVGLITEGDGGALTLDQDRKSIGKFLNRILGLPFDLQNALFEYFTDTIEAVIERAKKTGHYDLGILDVATSDQTLRRLSVHRFIRKHATGLAATELHRVSAERGMSWEEAERVWERGGSRGGFFLSQPRGSKREVILAVLDDEDTGKNDEHEYTIYRPNVGRQVRREQMSSILRKYKRAKMGEAREQWRLRYDASLETCSHSYWGGSCKKGPPGEECEVGLRRRVYNILSGSVLSVWNTVEMIVSKSSRLQVVRVRTMEGGKIVGTLVPSSCVEPLKEALQAGAINVTYQEF